MYRKLVCHPYTGAILIYGFVTPILVCVAEANPEKVYFSQNLEVCAYIKLLSTTTKKATPV